MTPAEVSKVLKDKLLTARLPQDKVPLAGVGTVTVRGLSRAEVLTLQKIDDKGDFERELLALGMLDPPMTAEEVGQWQKASPASELEVVTGKISELSGLRPGAQKAAYKSV